MTETPNANTGTASKYRLVNESGSEVDSIEVDGDSGARVWAVKTKVDRGLKTASLESLRGGRWQAIWDVEVPTLVDDPEDQA
jgi:hypothetical protein